MQEVDEDDNYDEMLEEAGPRTIFELIFNNPSNSPVIYNRLGTDLFHDDRYQEAIYCFKRALELRPTFMDAKQNLHNAYNNCIERWHYPMLNDIKRNTAFKDAISKAVKSGCKTVVDAGAGTGLLGMFAAASGATNVYACEMNPVMAAVGRDCVAANHMQNRIKILPKMSLGLSIPVNIPRKVDLVVSETIDAGIFGEGIIRTLKHAWEELLKAQPTGRVIPMAVTAWIYLIESEDIRKENKCFYEYRVKDKTKKYFITNSDSCPQYTCERLPLLRHGYRRLTEPVKAFHINFQQSKDFDRFFSYCWEEGLDSKMVCSAAGVYDAVVMSFDLHLDEDIVLGSHVESDTCWEQAIYPIWKFYCVYDTDDILLKPGETLAVNIKRKNGHLRLDSWRLEPRDLLDEETCFGKRCGASSTTLLKLNNEVYNRILMSFAHHFAQKSVLVIGWDVGAEALEFVSKGDFSRVGAYTRGECLVKLLYNSQKDKDCREYRDKFKEFDDDREANRPNPNDWDVFFVDFIGADGIFSQRILEHIAILHRVQLDRPDVKVFPGKLRLKGYLVESLKLIEYSEVLPDRTVGINVAEHINQFKVTTFQELELSTLEHKRLSDNLVLFDVDFNSNDVNPPLYLEITNEVRFKTTAAGRANAIVFWFEQDFEYDDMVDSLDTSALGGYWKQAAILFDVLEVKGGDEVCLTVALESSCVDITIKN